MEQMLPVIGIDLAVTAASELAVASGATIEASRKVASTPKGLTEGIRQAAKGRAVAIVVESTAMAWFIAAVAALRSGVEYRLYRVSGRKSAALRAFYRSHTKTDHIDARVLARMPAVDDSLLIYTLPAPSELALKRLVVARHRLTTETTKIQNRVRSLLAWAAPGMMKAAGGSVSSGLVHVLGRWSDLTALAKARVSTIALQGDWGTERAGAVRDAAAEAVAFYEGHVDFPAVSLELDVSLAQLGFLAGQITRLEERIAALHAELYPKDHLLSIPGIGPVVAGVVRAVVGDLSRFANQASFRAYTGLVPRESSSGEVRQRGRISKAGPSVLRWALYLAGDAARHCDPALAELYRRLMVDRGRTHTQAVCAVASHLAGRIYAVARQDRDYVWRDLAGNEITKPEARAIALSLRVDPETRARLRARREGGPRTPYARQPVVPQGVTQPSGDKLIEAALELATKV
jgi:transposase